MAAAAQHHYRILKKRNVDLFKIKIYYVSLNEGGVYEEDFDCSPWVGFETAMKILEAIKTC